MKRHSPRRVLIVQPYGIGDLLFLTPVLRALRLIPSVETVDLLLGSRTDAVIRTNPHVDKIFSMDRGKAQRQGIFENLREITALGRELRARHYDLLIDYSLRSDYAFFSQFLLGIPRRAGFAYKNRAFFHNIRLPLPEGFWGRHSVDFVCDLAQQAGIAVQDRFLEFYLQPRDREAAEHCLREKMGSEHLPYAAVSPGGGESWGQDAHFKRWPPSAFAEFLNRMAKKVNFESVLILGSAKERALADELVRDCMKPAVNLCGEISLETSAAIIEKARFFAGNDGGLVHLACALQRPVIAFYGPVDPAGYGPYPKHPQRAAVYKEGLECRPCYRKFRYNSACANRECLQALSASEAFDLLDRKDFFSSLK